MPEEASEAAHLLHLKNEVLERFQQLSPEHQATMGLVLVKSIVDGEWGRWFQDALAAQYNISEKAVVAPFIYTVSREHLRRIHTSDEEIERLSDEDLATIAKLIHEHFITDAYWDELAFITDLVLAGKRNKS